jgi:hypothetical protein
VGSRSSEPDERVNVNDRLRMTLGILQALAVILVGLGLTAVYVGNGAFWRVESGQLIMAGTLCLVGAPILALLPLAAHFISQRSKAGWYALGTLAITLLGILLAAR